MTLNEFYLSLESKRKFKDPADPYERITHCVLSTTHGGEDHLFHVRGWAPIKDGKLIVAVVNWTLCAGTATLELTEDSVRDFKFYEEA